MYGKHFEQMYSGSMFGQPALVFAVWGYVIAYQRYERGEDACFVELNPTLLGAMFASKPEEVAEAIAILEAPDPSSRTPDSDGRRLILTEDGRRHLGPMQFLVVNGKKYRDLVKDDERRAANRAAAKRYRERHQASSSVINHHQNVIPSEADADSDSERERERASPLPPPTGADAPPGLSPSARAKPGWVLLWQLWDQELNAGKGGDMRSHEERLSAAWRACSAHNPDDPLGAFRAAGKAFIRHREESGKKLGLAVLCSQLDVWLESEPPPRTEADRQADLDRTMAENDALVANQKVVTR